MMEEEQILIIHQDQTLQEVKGVEVEELQQQEQIVLQYLLHQEVQRDQVETEQQI
jgi:hypothetical protein